MSLIFREARAEDAALLARLYCECFTDAWDEASFREALSNPATLALVAGDAAANESQAFIVIHVMADESEILTLGTVPAARRGGFAKKLLARAMAQAHARGARTMFLEVAESNKAALALYRQAGFAIAGRRASYYRQGAQPPVDALRLSAAIDRVGSGPGLD